MKCPECNHNHKRGKDGMKCLRCERRFIFDPKKHANGGKGLTDAYFIKCIEKLSRNGTYFFTEDELYCFMAQQTRPGMAGCIIGAFIITAIITGGLHLMMALGIWPAFFVLPILVLMAVKISNSVLSRKKWAKYLRHWQQMTGNDAHKDNHLSAMLTTPQLLEKPSQANEPDIYDYGAAKLLICEHDIQVDWLVKNGFHAENGIVIISENFYPQYLTEQVQELIKNNPDLDIYTLHNSDSNGESMIGRLQNPLNNWGLGGLEIVDLGLSSEHLLKAKLNKKIIEQYNGDFPVHGIAYHQFHPVLNHCLLHGVTFTAAYATLYSSIDSGGSSGFGVSGDFG